MTALRRVLLGGFPPLLALCLVLTGIAHAGELPLPTVEYSADRQLESEMGSFSMKVYSARDKERAEMEMGGMRMATIVRLDKKVAWLLMPVMEMYQELDLDQAQQQTGHFSSDVEITEVGSEKIDGVATTKYKLLVKDKSAEGFVWLTKDNIPLLMDLMAKDDTGKTMRMKMTLKNLKVGKQDSSLFELPKGYMKMPAMGGMGMMQPQ